MRFKPDRAHYIPGVERTPDLRTREDAESTAVAYTYTRGANLLALYFSGKRQKPDEHINYGSAAGAFERREAAIARHFERVRARERYQTERREQIKAASAAAKTLAVPADGYMSAPAVAALLRQCLKEAFPGVRFSVRSDRCLRVTWTDGPSRKQVERIAGTFAGSYFDGMIDYEGSIYHSFDGQKVRFGCSFVFCERTMSAEALTIGAEALAAEYTGTNQAPATIEPPRFDGWSPTVTANPDFPGACVGRFPDDVELKGPDSEDWETGRFHRAPFALELWFNAARPVEVQPSPTFARVAVLGTDGYGNTALGAADGGETGRGYPERRDPPEADRMREAIAGAESDLAAELAALVDGDAEATEPPRVVACEVIDFAPHLAAHIARADAARRVN
jgi:hypothetical protein